MKTKEDLSMRNGLKTRSDRSWKPNSRMQEGDKEMTMKEVTMKMR
jgi:hypothetical protein